MNIKKIHLVPNVITALGLCCGLFVIFKMTMEPLGQVDEQSLTIAAGILMLALFADVIDGAIARAMKAESTFGSLFDSLADAISFGVGPSVIVLKTFSMEPGTEMSFLIKTAAMIYVVCGVLRLCRFSVQAEHATEDLDLLTAHKKNFTGLPIPAAAGGVVSANLLLLSADLRYFIHVGDLTRFWIMVAVMFFLGYLMVSHWKFPSLKTLRLRVASFQLVIAVVLTAAIIFYGILHHFAPVFFLISWGYIFLALTLSTIRLIYGKKSKTLEDFEPDWDE